MIPENLEEITLSNTHVTDNNVKALGERLKKLKKATMYNCPNLRFADIVLGEAATILLWDKSTW